MLLPFYFTFTRFGFSRVTTACLSLCGLSSGCCGFTGFSCQFCLLLLCLPGRDAPLCLFLPDAGFPGSRAQSGEEQESGETKAAPFPLHPQKKRPGTVPSPRQGTGKSLPEPLKKYAPCQVKVPPEQVRPGNTAACRLLSDQAGTDVIKKA